MSKNDTRDCQWLCEAHRLLGKHLTSRMLGGSRVLVKWKGELVSFAKIDRMMEKKSRQKREKQT